MDQGIIQNFETFYRKLVVERILRTVEGGQPVTTKPSPSFRRFTCCILVGTKLHSKQLQTISNMLSLYCHKKLQLNLSLDEMETIIEAAIPGPYRVTHMADPGNI